MRVKICGITKPEQGRAIALYGATALGFICVPQSPRYVMPQRIADIIAKLPAPHQYRQPLDLVGVFADAEISTIEAVMAIAPLTAIQLHGHESPQFCQALKRQLPHIEIIKALRVQSPDALSQSQRYESVVDTLLLDAYHPNLLGGTGMTLNWAILENFYPPRPWLLAGGLNPDNISDALTHLQPDGIDLSSGVEHQPGNKDLTKVARLFEQLQTFKASSHGA
ncbi:MAG TPA: phosphoribosylanthranilate isomerase [Elainellaceae cyanobacterium]